MTIAGGEVTYLLDTHTWIWWHARPENRSNKVRNILSDSRKYKALLISAISIGEFSKLVSKGRMTIAIEGDHWIEHDGNVGVCFAEKRLALRILRAPPRDPHQRILEAKKLTSTITLFFARRL